MTPAGIQAICFSALGLLLVFIGLRDIGLCSILVANIWAVANYLESRR